MVSLDLTFLASILNFLLLTALLTVFLYRPIRRFLRERQEKIQNDLLSAEAARREAERLKAEYEDQLGLARKEVHDIIERAVRQAEETEKEILQSAHEEARRIIERSAKQASVEREEAWVKLRDDVARLALLMASRVVGKVVDQQIDERLVEDLIREYLDTKAGDPT